MDGSFYARNPSTFVDGSLIFKSEEDEQKEADMAAIVSKAWRCECGSFGKLALIDWYFVRDGRLVGVGELKNRAHSSTQFATVFMSVRKWIALLLASTGLGVPAVFVVRFTDCSKWVSVSEVDATNVRIGGCSKPRAMRSRNDMEPVIEVPVLSMRDLRA